MATNNKNDSLNAPAHQVNESASMGSKLPIKEIEHSNAKKRKREKALTKLSAKGIISSVCKVTQASSGKITGNIKNLSKIDIKTNKRKIESFATEIAKNAALTAEEMLLFNKIKESLALLRADSEWASFIKDQKDILLAMEAELLPNMHSNTREHFSKESSSAGEHLGDAGSDAEVHNITIRILDKHREQLMEITSALERIDEGIYGICEISYEPIPKLRLSVRPFCRLSVKCQEEYEEKFGLASVYRPVESKLSDYFKIENEGESVIHLDENL